MQHTDILQVAAPPISISPWLILEAAEEVAVAAADVVVAIILDMLAVAISIDIELDMMRVVRECSGQFSER